MEETSRIWTESGKDGEPKYPNGNWVRNNIRIPNRVLLLLYLLDPEGANLDINSSPIVGFAISFPGTNRNDAVAYAVHEQLLPLFNHEDTIEEIENEDED